MVALEYTSWVCLKGSPSGGHKQQGIISSVKTKNPNWWPFCASVCLFIYLIGRGQVLAPSRSDIPPEPPTLMAFLNSSSNFTLIRQFDLVWCLSVDLCPSDLDFVGFQCVLMCISSQVYNLSSNLSVYDFTLLLPTDDAIRQHLSRTNTSLLVGPDDKSHCCLPSPLLWSK